MNSFLRFFCGGQAISAVLLQFILSIEPSTARSYVRISLLSVAAGVWTCGYILARWLPRGELKISVPEGTLVTSVPSSETPSGGAE